VPAIVVTGISIYSDVFSHTGHYFQRKMHNAVHFSSTWSEIALPFGPFIASWHLCWKHVLFSQVVRLAQNTNTSAYKKSVCIMISFLQIQLMLDFGYI